MNATPDTIAHGSAEMLLACLSEALARTSAHAAAAASHAAASNIHGAARETRAAATALLAAADLAGELEPYARQQGRAA